MKVVQKVYNRKKEKLRDNSHCRQTMLSAFLFVTSVFFIANKEAQQPEIKMTVSCRFLISYGSENCDYNVFSQLLKISNDVNMMASGGLRC